MECDECIVCEGAAVAASAGEDEWVGRESSSVEVAGKDVAELVRTECE